MEPSEITFQRIMIDWFLTADVEGYRAHEASFKIIHILCNCHQQVRYDRALGAINSEELSVRLFPRNDSESRGDHHTWIWLYPADPDFFTKLIKSLDEVHIARFHASVVRSSQGLG